MAKKAYQLKPGVTAFTTTVNPQGKQVHLTPDDDVYETDDPVEQDHLDYAVADSEAGLVKKEKGGK